MSRTKQKQKLTHVDEQIIRCKNFFQKMLQKTTIYKADVISLKQQARVLSELDEGYRSLYSRITTQVNGMRNGNLSPERREKVDTLFNEYFA